MRPSHPGIVRFRIKILPGITGLLLAAGILTASCAGGGKAGSSVAAGRTSSFHDPEGFFEVQIPAELEYRDRSTEGARVYEFLKTDEANNPLEIVRFTVEMEESGKKADLFNTAYEQEFLSGCHCAILERGVVNFAGQPARQYTTSLNNGERISYQRHIISRNRILIIDVRGPVSDQTRIRTLFDKTMSSFVLLQEGDSHPQGEVKKDFKP